MANCFFLTAFARFLSATGSSIHTTRLGNGTTRTRPTTTAPYGLGTRERRSAPSAPPACKTLPGNLQRMSPANFLTALAPEAWRQTSGPTPTKTAACAFRAPIPAAARWRNSTGPRGSAFWEWKPTCLRTKFPFVPAFRPNGKKEAPKSRWAWKVRC